MPEGFRVLYEQYPMWGFYTDGTMMKRVYGMLKRADGSYAAQTATSMALMTNLTVGGTALSQLVRVDRWTTSRKLPSLSTARRACFSTRWGS